MKSSDLKLLVVLLSCHTRGSVELEGVSLRLSTETWKHRRITIASQQNIILVYGISTKTLSSIIDASNLNPNNSGIIELTGGNFGLITLDWIGYSV